MIIRSTVFLDLETTGLNPEADRIVEIGIIHFDKDGNQTKLGQIINPECKIPQEVIDVHGITNEVVEGKPTFAELAEELYENFFNPDTSKNFCAYNFKFDYKFIKKEFERVGIQLNNLDYTFIDPCAIFRAAIPHTLESAVRLYLDKEHTNAHRALDDIEVTLEVFKAQTKKHYPLFKKGLKTLQEELLGTCEYLSDWFNKTDKGFEFTKGKYKEQAFNIKDSQHTSYVYWISGLKDISKDDKDLIQALLNGDI